MNNEIPENLNIHDRETEQRFYHGLQLGSTSGHKIEALKSACEKLGIKAEIKTTSVESEVNAQPFGFDETHTGALNRAKHAQSQNPEAPAIGIENGVIPIGDKFVDLAVVIILMPSGKSFISTSNGIEFPKEAVDVARSRGFESTTVGEVIAETMGGSITDPHSFLTGGKIYRKEILAEAIESALSQALFF